MPGRPEGVAAVLPLGADQDEEALPEALRDAAWQRHRFLIGRVLARWEHRDPLQAGPFRQRPAFLTRVLNDLVRRQWKGRGITCQVQFPLLDGGRSYEFAFSKGGRWLRETNLPRTWFHDIFEKGLAIHEGCLVAHAALTPGHEDADACGGWSSASPRPSRRATGRRPGGPSTTWSTAAAGRNDGDPTTPGQPAGTRQGGGRGGGAARPLAPRAASPGESSGQGQARGPRQEVSMFVPSVSVQPA